jgi:hypothetical protein
MASRAQLERFDHLLLDVSDDQLSRAVNDSMGAWSCRRRCRCRRPNLATRGRSPNELRSINPSPAPSDQAAHVLLILGEGSDPLARRQRYSSSPVVPCDGMTARAGDGLRPRETAAGDRLADGSNGGSVPQGGVAERGGGQVTARWTLHSPTFNPRAARTAPDEKAGRERRPNAGSTPLPSRLPLVWNHTRIRRGTRGKVERGWRGA